MKINSIHEIEHVFNQEDVNQFIKISGDANPLHWDEAYASQTVFKKPIVHGAFILGIFSKIMGMEFPGKGSIYMKHELEFKRPCYVNSIYVFKFKVLEIDSIKHMARITTQVFEKERGKIMVDGIATVMNVELF